jgi:hypothetical protein
MFLIKLAQRQVIEKHITADRPDASSQRLFTNGSQTPVADTSALPGRIDCESIHVDPLDTTRTGLSSVT